MQNRLKIVDNGVYEEEVPFDDNRTISGVPERNGGTD